MKVCMCCGEKLRWSQRGWVHQDGQLYKQRYMTAREKVRFKERHGRLPWCHEQLVDDHCALPVDAVYFKAQVERKLELDE